MRLNIVAGLGCFCLHNLLFCLSTLPTGNFGNFTDTRQLSHYSTLPCNPLLQMLVPSEIPGLFKLQSVSQVKGVSSIHPVIMLDFVFANSLDSIDWETFLESPSSPHTQTGLRFFFFFFKFLR